MKKIFLIMMLTTFGLYAQSTKLTLEESLKLGLEKSYAMQISKSKSSYAEAKYSETAAQLLPRISLSANYTRLSDIPPFQISIPISPTPITVQEAILNNYGIKLSLQQPLFTGFKLVSLKSASDLNYKASLADTDKDANETAFAIHQSFWNIYKAQKVLELINNNYESIAQHLKDTKNFLANGLATKNDVLKMEVTLSNLEMLKIDAQNNLNISQAVFNKTIGLEINSDTEIQTIDPSLTETSIDYPALLTEALSNRDELKATGYRVEAGKEMLSASQAGWFPSIYLAANYNYARPNQRIMPSKDQFDDTWDVSLVLNWELWNWGQTSAQVTQAEQQLIQSESTEKILKDNIEIEVYQSYLRMNSESSKVNVAQVTLTQAEENYRITNEKYNEQLATSTDLIDAENSLLDAQTKLTNALVDYQLAKVRLEKAVGRRIY
ncbi:MAG: TolC family protein [bacterium]